MGFCHLGNTNGHSGHLGNIWSFGEQMTEMVVRWGTKTESAKNACHLGNMARGIKIGVPRFPRNRRSGQCDGGGDHRQSADRAPQSKPPATGRQRRRGQRVGGQRARPRRRGDDSDAALWRRDSLCRCFRQRRIPAVRSRMGREKGGSPENARRDPLALDEARPLRQAGQEGKVGYLQ